jgi:uncharacterized protein with HEPN domain
MSRRDWLLFVEDMIESIGLVESYVKGMTEQQFGADRKTVDAVIRNFEIIGEASKHVPENIKASSPQTDWTGLLGLRNRIAHEYFGVSVAIVWQIVKKDLPALKTQMEALLAQHAGKKA